MGLKVLAGFTFTERLFYSSEIHSNPRTGIFNLRHPDPARLILIGPMLTAAGNFEWLRCQFGDLEVAASNQAGANAYDLLNQQGLQFSAPPGSAQVAVVEGGRQ